jgi:Family of unknown function (DUF6498)
MPLKSDGTGAEGTETTAGNATRALRLTVALLFAAYNLMPLYGIWYWGWDAFQLLILYWSETVVLAAWTMVRLALVPNDLLGDITINGKVQKATHTSLIGVMALTAAIFCAAHLLFLCVIFSGDWFKRLHGFGDFLHTFYIASGMWMPLALVTLAGLADVLTGAFRPQFMNALTLRLRLAPSAPPATTEDPVGSIIGAMLSRIVFMQVAIICGAWVALRWGSMAPLAILVGAKTLFDFSHRSSR